MSIAKEKYSKGLVEITERDLDALHIGTWILGTGGGGDPYQKYINMKLLYEKGYRAQLLDPACLDDDDVIAVLSNMGAPIVGQERLADPNFAVKPVTLMETYLGRPFDAVMPLEIGGGNGVHPLMVGVLKGLPIVDADCMGRAYPEAQMTSFAVAGLQMYPFALSDIRHNEMIITKAETWKWLERIGRSAVSEMGAVGATVKAPRTGREVKEHGLKYTVTKAINIGKAVMDANKHHADPIDAILQESVGKMLFQGKVSDVERRVTGGFLKGKTTIRGVGEYNGSEMTVHFQNEFSVAELDGNVVVTTPDLICLLDTVSGAGIGTDTIRYGQRLSVIAMPSEPIFATTKGLEYVGPKAFGFDLDYKTVF